MYSWTSVFQNVLLVSCLVLLLLSNCTISKGHLDKGIWRVGANTVKYMRVVLRRAKKTLRLKCKEEAINGGGVQCHINRANGVTHSSPMATLFSTHTSVCRLFKHQLANSWTTCLCSWGLECGIPYRITMLIACYYYSSDSKNFSLSNRQK